MKNKHGIILYIGKAKNLKKRVSSYFQKQDHSPKTKVMVSLIHDIQIVITDTGKGIPKKIKDTLFLPFTKDEYSFENTGLGLSIAKNFIELHGGEIWVQSELGSGTKFWFTLPKHLLKTEWK